jgi:hypothetical protein
MIFLMDYEFDESCTYMMTDGCYALLHCTALRLLVGFG